MDGDFMPLTVKGDGGVSVQYGGTKLILDPSRRSNSYPYVFITHAHYDHSKGFGFKEPTKISTVESKDIVAVYGKDVKRWKPLQIGERIKFDDLEVVSHNAGHVLGSVLYEVITSEGNLVYTGDVQFEDSLTLKGAEPVSCDILILESTFGTPSFSFPKRYAVAQEMVQWAQEKIKSGRIPAFKADSLGNAQEVTKAFNIYSKLPVIVHHRVAQINEIYNARGHSLEYLDSRSEEASEVKSSGEYVLVTPKNSNLSDHPVFETALVSGWSLWKRNQRSFALSDHGDFNQLMDYVKACNPSTVLTCHGGRFNTVLANQVGKQLGIEARPLDLITTKFFPTTEIPRVKSCMKEILKALRMPGFLYSKRWIADEMKPLGFSYHEIDEALDRLTRRGLLNAS